MSRLDYSPRSHEPQVENWEAKKTPVVVLTMHTGNDRIIVEPGLVYAYTNGGNLRRPGTRGDLRFVARFAKKGSKERAVLDQNIPAWRRFAGLYKRDRQNQPQRS